MTHDDDLLEGSARAELVEQREQDVVDDEEPVLRVRRDEREIVRREPQVERVHHASGERRAEVRLEMRRVVPHQGRDPIAAPQTRPEQRSRQRAGAFDHRAPRGAVQRAVRLPRNDLDVGEVPGGSIRQDRYGEGQIHHGAAHRTPPRRGAVYRGVAARFEVPRRQSVRKPRTGRRTLHRFRSRSCG